MTNIWDIIQPKDNWERNYAHMEYLLIGARNLWGYTKHIEVSYE